MKRAALLILLCCALASCKDAGNQQEPLDTSRVETEAPASLASPSASSTSVETEEEISPTMVDMTASLDLYQVNGTAEYLHEMTTPTSWYPITMRVVGSTLPYAGSDVITSVPVYSCYGGGNNCIWVGDLISGTEVTITSFENGYCYVAGTSKQGWQLTGWVSCSSLSDE